MTHTPREQSRDVSMPQPGYFKIRMVRRGPWVAARITYDGAVWGTVIDDVPSNTTDPDPWQVTGLERIWTGGRVIDQAEYEHLLSVAAWARAHAPDHPAANPEQPIDLDTINPAYLGA